MKKSQFKVALVGNGKLSKAIVLGLLSKKFHGPEIIVIGRENPTSDFTSYELRGVTVVTDMQSIAEADCILLAVTPSGAGPVLERMHAVVFPEDKKYEIISFVSGLTPHQIREHVSVSTEHLTVIQATCNTNVSVGKGIICSDHYSPLLSKLGAVTIEKADRILRSIVSVGAMNAFDYKAIYLIFEALALQNENHYTFHQWLVGLSRMLSTFDFNKPVDKKYTGIRQYLNIKRKILANPQFQHGIKSKERAVETMQSCVRTLLSSRYGMNVSISSVNELIKSVVTKGGCTETGIGSLESIRDINHDNLEKALLKVWERTCQFKFDVRDSMTSVQV